MTMRVGDIAYNKSFIGGSLRISAFCRKLGLWTKKVGGWLYAPKKVGYELKKYVRLAIQKM